MTINAVYELPFGHGKQFLNGGGALRSSSADGNLPASAAPAPGFRSTSPMIAQSRARCSTATLPASGPNLVPGVPIYAANQTINNWFNPAAFSAPGQRHLGQPGPLYRQRSRASMRSTRSLQKRFRITERLALNFRAAAFNLFNHPIYKNPGGSIGSLTGNPPSVSGELRPDHRHSEHGRHRHRRPPPHRVHVPRRVLTGGRRLAYAC